MTYVSVFDILLSIKLYIYIYSYLCIDKILSNYVNGRWIPTYFTLAVKCCKPVILYLKSVSSRKDGNVKEKISGKSYLKGSRALKASNAVLMSGEVRVNRNFLDSLIASHGNVDHWIVLAVNSDCGK